MGGRDHHAMIVCMYALACITIALLFHRTLPHEMYMDEVFHIKQTQKYCDGLWTEW